MSNNIEYIYSNKLHRTHPQALLHMVVRKEYFDEISNRSDIINNDKFLQVAYLNLHKDQTFKAHKHIYSKFYTDTKIANEGWYVIRGKILAHYYDIDNLKLAESVLEEGDMTLTLSHGGHNYTALEEGTRAIEIKSGPYFGVDKDKELI